MSQPDLRKGIIIQARMNSTRLPGKILKPISGRPMLKILLRRLESSRLVDDVIVATTDQPADDAVWENVRQWGYSVCRGPEDDVLARYLQAAEEFNLDVIVRITADCPLMDAGLVDEMLENYLSETDQVDYFSNTLERTFPRGLDVEIFSRKVLQQAARKARHDYQREHVTPYMRENMRCHNWSACEDSSRFRVTVDTSEDFELVCKVFERSGGIDASLDHRSLVRLLSSDPSLAVINHHVKQKEIRR
jgi:spore coat polysaccharide biosynthesis protein SpsF